MSSVVNARLMLPLAAALVLAAPLAPWAQEPSGPSFSCAHATSEVNKLICASADLSALDRELASVYGNMKGQPGIDMKAVQRDEDSWLKDLHNRCGDFACIRAAYESRIAVLRDQSRQAASPAAYDETRDFPAPAAALAAARAAIGKACTVDVGKGAPAFAGFTAPPPNLPIVSKGATVVIRESGGTRFAFLLATPLAGGCTVSDVAVLPPVQRGDAVLQCAIADPPSHGFGVRRAGGVLAGDWEVDTDLQRFDRVALGVLGVKPRCQEPETGE
jgi:uncharacterized protein